jgi:hypothetical protein
MFKSSPIQASEPVFVSVSEWQGKPRFDIRHYYSLEVTEDDAVRIDLRPGTKGINVPVEDAGAVISAVLAVVEMATVSPNSENKIQPKTSCVMPVVVSVNEWKGVRRIDIRHYWTPKGSTKLTPTQKGVSVAITEAGTLVDALTAARETLAASQSATPRRPEADILRDLGYQPVVADHRFANVEL